ncbi:type II toxin-antitoxin system HicB family antitoxin [Aminithiophilus ramosus]|uniref:Type II toxin-antitoxin system HicB family antitoxin n=1 Tax=Aminithiophilus ramosus TaxID=3029084 RepID=A0A9Q7AB09_9BACT|nr:type II toxin-antitoxin system HicB family antitoxin [Aminithiophilus ramosus]QTX31818.1 type II toxin-antitoxin system HicB family antitoxin [Aminithiophilus ramosus]
MATEHVFPAIFTHDTNGYTIEFPDLPEVTVHADSPTNAIHNAQMALYQHLVDREQRGEILPEPSPDISIVSSLNKGQFIISINPTAFPHYQPIVDSKIEKDIELLKLIERHSNNLKIFGGTVAGATYSGIIYFIFNYKDIANKTKSIRYWIGGWYVLWLVCFFIYFFLTITLFKAERQNRKNIKYILNNSFMSNNHKRIYQETMLQESNINFFNILSFLFKISPIFMLPITVFYPIDQLNSLDKPLAVFFAFIMAIFFFCLYQKIRQMQEKEQKDTILRVFSWSILFSAIVFLVFFIKTLHELHNSKIKYDIFSTLILASSRH